MTRYANGLFYLHGHFGCDLPMSVLETSCGRLGNANQFPQFGAGKLMLLPIFPQNPVRFGHNDTYGIGPSRPMSIPIVSDCLQYTPYHPVMVYLRGDPRTGWGKRFREFLQDKGKSLAWVAQRMPSKTKEGESLNESTLRSWTNGTRKINLVDFFAICEIAEADPAVILFGKPIMSEDHIKKTMGIVQKALGHTDEDETATTNGKERKDA